VATVLSPRYIGSMLCDGAGAAPTLPGHLRPEALDTVNTPAVAIREINDSGAGELACVVREAFAEVALQFSLTAANCPTHPSQCEESWISREMAGGRRFYACHHGETMVGCYGMEWTSHQACKLTRFAVVPKWQRRGIGTLLLEDARARARKGGSRMLEVGVLHDNQKLVSWYCSRGFELSGTARYPHLPFTVGFLFADL
jgi:GNAT superfamily N-acetyltransferase